MDKRIQRTKRRLSEALINLILERGYENVTVQDILDKADIGRSTFYSHYEDKDQLLKAGPTNLGVVLFEQRNSLNGESAGQGINFVNLFKHVSANRRLAKAMLGKKSGNIIFEVFENRISSVVKEKYQPRFSNSKKDKIMLGYLAQSAASAVTCFLRRWVDDDFIFTPEEMSLRCQKVLEAMFNA